MKLKLNCNYNMYDSVPIRIGNEYLSPEIHSRDGSIMDRMCTRLDTIHDCTRMKYVLPQFHSRNEVGVAWIFITRDTNDDHLSYKYSPLEFQPIIKITWKRFYADHYHSMNCIKNDNLSLTPYYIIDFSFEYLYGVV